METTKEVLTKVYAYVKAYRMIEQHDRVIVGVSGGADSVCLLFVLKELQKRIKFSVVVVHVNHCLRGAEAMHDEQYVKNLCQQLDIPCETYSYDVELIAKKRKQSTEEAGRILRQEAFQDAKRTLHGTKIATAHHMNDNAETLLMNLARGTGLKGLGGIQPVRGVVIRPLLCLERGEIESYLQEQGISYCTDSTNAGNDYTRNRIRNQILPLIEEHINAQAILHMNDTMVQMRELQAYIENQLQALSKQCVKEEEDGQIIFLDAYRNMPPVFQSRMIHKCLVEVTGVEQDLTQRHIRQIQELMSKQVGKSVDLPHCIRAKRIYVGVKIQKQKGMKERLLDRDGMPRVTYRILDDITHQLIPEKTYTKWFDYDIIKNDLEVRTRKPGDYITIDSNGNTQKLKSYFINKKIPSELRDQIYLIADGNHILWIIGYRMSSYYQVSEKTQRVLEIQIDGGK